MLSRWLSFLKSVWSGVYSYVHVLTWQSDGMIGALLAVFSIQLLYPVHTPSPYV